MGKMEEKLVGHFHDIMKAYGLVGSPDARMLERVEKCTNQLAQTIREGTVDSAIEVSKRLQNAVAASMENIEAEFDRLDRKIEDGDRSGAEAMGQLIAQCKDIIKKSNMILDAVSEDASQPDEHE